MVGLDVATERALRFKVKGWAPFQWRRQDPLLNGPCRCRASLLYCN